MTKYNFFSIFRKFLYYAKPFKKLYIFSFIVMLVNLVIELIQPIFLQKSLQSIEKCLPRELKIYALFFLSTILGDYICRVSSYYMIQSAFIRTTSSIRSALFHNILKQNMAYIDKNPSGNLLSKIVGDTVALSSVLHGGTVTILLDFLTILGYLYLMFALELQLSMIMLFTLPFVTIFVHWIGKQLYSQTQKIRQCVAQMTTFMNESIQGVEILRLFHAEQQSRKEFQKWNEQHRNLWSQSNFYDALLFSSIEAISFITQGLIIYVGCIVLDEYVPLSTVIVYIHLVNKIYLPIRDFSMKFATIQTALAALKRIFTHLEITEPLIEHEYIDTLQSVPIYMKNVYFRYNESTSNVLDNISLEIQPYTTTAFVGTTGSGKSTIAKILLRYYDNYQGNITIQNKELKNINKDNLRKSIALIPQDITIFPGTLRENITLFDPMISDEKIVQTLEKLQAHTLLQKGNLNQRILENGKNLSAGQRQLISFARAFILDTPIILLDEATSNIDSVTETWIQRTLQQLTHTKTLIIIAHRLATISHADQIYVLEQGRVIQSGTHSTLLQDKNGFYAQLHLTQ
ncbi:MAG TPA: ABC transporter ATP-binding protein [Planctomycetota bacterium]|jgi:ABC-type multidrug transport system fused ATPase/permease subunit|nr:ABC transporter ATP-binding protein [Planctomycetota bacterium]HQB00494.1 ABC transporter ATP-binding protein [Planctomycetota bacterium]